MKPNQAGGEPVVLPVNQLTLSYDEFIQAHVASWNAARANIPAIQSDATAWIEAHPESGKTVDLVMSDVEKASR